MNVDAVGQKVLINVSSNVGTSFHLYKNGERISSRNGDGQFEISYSQGDLNAYKVGADTPYGYRNTDSQNVKLSVDNSTRIASAENISFHFSRSTLHIVVGNMVKGTDVNLYSTASNEIVETKKATGYTDVTFDVP